MKPNQHHVAAELGERIRAFRRDYTDAPRLLAEYCDLGSATALYDAEDKLQDQEELETAKGEAESNRDWWRERFEFFAKSVWGIITSCHSKPKDLDLCSPGVIIGQLEDCFMDEFPEEIEAILPKLQRKSSSIAMGLDPDFPESFPDDLLDELIRLRRPHLLTGAGVPSSGPGSPEPEAERSAPTPTPTPPPQAVTPPAPAAAPPAAPAKVPRRDRQKPEVPAATAPPVITRNEPRNGIEIRFNGKPEDATRDAMKAQGFRWLPRVAGMPWVAPYTEERWVFAHNLAGSPPQAEAERSAPPQAAAPPATPPPPAAPETPATAPTKFQLPDFLR